jgi:hypothetical protein
VKTQEPLDPFSFFRTHLSTDTLRRQQGNRISLEVQGFRITIGWIVFLRDEAPGANLTHPASYNLGFTQGGSSPLMSNALKFCFGMCFRCKNVLGERRVSKKTEGLLPTGAHAHNQKSAVICGVTSRSVNYMKT